MSFKVAIAQTAVISALEGPPTHESPHSSPPFPTLDANLAEAARRVAEAKQKGAEVVVFSEYFLQGATNDGRQYLTFPSTYLFEFVQSLAKQHAIAIVGSIVVSSFPPTRPAPPAVSPFAHVPLGGAPAPPARRITDAQLAWAKYLEAYPATAEERAEPVLHNTAFFIDERGDVVGRYIKRNLWHSERAHLTAGEEEHQVFDTKWGKAGLLICWDVSHPAAAQALSDQGADIVFAPTYWLSTDSDPLILKYPSNPTYETTMLSALSFARAFETETVWVMCNAGGDPADGFMGGSAVWAPLLGRVGGFDGAQTGVWVGSVPLGVLKDGRETYKIREDWAARQAS
ncbi:hypothetical protein Q5752_004744 [Cryptotrichosporon argae]